MLTHGWPAVYPAQGWEVTGTSIGQGDWAPLPALALPTPGNALPPPTQFHPCPAQRSPCTSQHMGNLPAPVLSTAGLTQLLALVPHWSKCALWHIPNNSGPM